MTENPKSTSNPQPYTGRVAQIYERLRRLRDQAHANISGIIAPHDTQSHTLHEENAPWEATYRVQVMVYPQDPFVGEPEIRHMTDDDIQPGLINARVQIVDSIAPPARPDENGNYLFAPGTIWFEQVNAFYYTTLTLRMYERYARRALPWAFPFPRIKVNPHMGSEVNAYYDEQARTIGFHSFMLNGGKTRISTAQSADIVSHEAGHAVLDGLRDLWNESFSLGTAAFHESFGDMTAVLVALHDDSLIRRVLDWTGSNMQMDNIISAMAEELTHALRQPPAADTATTNAATTPTLQHTIYIRNALNTLASVPFDALEYSPTDPATTLSRQPHNYSRLFTGAFYDCLIGVYDHLKAQGDLPHIALARARDIMGRLLVTAVEVSPVGELDFGDMARAFIAAETLLWDGEYGHILNETFTRRGIITRTELEAFRQAQRSLPAIRLPETINTALASSLYLQDKLIPALNLPKHVEFFPMTTYRNADGYVFMTYFTQELMVLNDLGGNLRLMLYGGLSLAYSPDNLLCCANYRPVTDEDRRQIRVMVGDVLREGQVMRISAMRETDPLPPLGVVIEESESPNAPVQTLLRYPAIVDQVEDEAVSVEPGSFIRYLRHIASGIAGIQGDRSDK